MSDPADHVVSVGALPATIDELVALRDRIAVTPHGGAAAFAVALACYARDPAQGVPYITVAIAMDLLDDDPDGYKGRRPRRALLQNLRDRIAGKPHIARSYFQGTSPAAGYALPAGDLTVRVKEQPGSMLGADRAKLFVYSSGADSPRPVALARNDRGLWKATEWSSLEVGVRAPAAARRDDL